MRNTNHPPRYSATADSAMSVPATKDIQDATALSCSQTRAESARVETNFESLGADETKIAFNELDSLLSGHAANFDHTLDQMTPDLAAMQSLLSQRGKERKKVLKQAGLPSWTQYAKEYAQRIDRSMRTIQDRIMRFRNDIKRDPSPKQARQGNKRPRLDARQQSALVRAQLATNDLVAALKNGADWQAPLAEYDKVAVTPAKLDSFVNAVASEPDWKDILNQLVETLELHGDRLPVPVLAQMRAVRKLLVDDKPQLRLAQSNTTVPVAAKQYRVEERTKDGKAWFAVVCDGEKRPYGMYEPESEANKVCESLNTSPVYSLTELDTAKPKPPRAATVSAGGKLNQKRGTSSDGHGD